MRVPHYSLKALAAATWYVGGAVLVYQGSGYLVEAAGAGAAWPAGAAAAGGVTVGIVRGRSMFREACLRNLRRIDALEYPRVWQFFHPGFFLALVLMVAGGIVLSRLAGVAPWAAVVIGGLELVIATGLLTSSITFWRCRSGLLARVGREC
ncbi:MAG: hypothetical protein ACLFRX_11740 [Gemmatimonadota bacterium]